MQSSASGLYRPEATTWVKIKNPEYRRAEGREDIEDRANVGVLELGDGAGLHLAALA